LFEGCTVENTSSLNGLGHGIEQWVRQMERLTPLASQDRNQLLELLLVQMDLGACWQSLPIVRQTLSGSTRSSSTAASPIPDPHPPQARLTLHAYPFELRGRHEQLLGQLHYELEHPERRPERMPAAISSAVQPPLPLYLRLDRLELQVGSTT
jgi:hypothetical protein